MPLALADPPGSVVRVGHRPDPFDWPPPPAPMAALPDPPGGYRWDDPEGSFQTLYVATEPTGAFIETLQDLRPRADLKAIIAAKPTPAAARSFAPAASRKRTSTPVPSRTPT